MTLLSMLLALSYGGLRAATRAADKGQAILEDSSRIRMAHQFVRKQLNQIVPLTISQNEDGSERVVFEGDADRVRFVSPMPGYLGFGGPQIQELSIVASEEGQALVLSHALLQGFDEQYLYENPPIVLLDKIETAKFAYLGRNEDEELESWAQQWDQPDILPESVSLEIEFQDEVYIQWPLLTASVRVDASAVSEQRGRGRRAGSLSTRVQDMIDRRKQGQNQQ
jgi:general secretion pathway protein J